MDCGKPEPLAPLPLSGGGLYGVLVSTGAEPVGFPARVAGGGLDGVCCPWIWSMSAAFAFVGPTLPCWAPRASASAAGSGADDGADALAWGEGGWPDGKRAAVAWPAPAMA
jgi:hypothetical protein